MIPGELQPLMLWLASAAAGMGLGGWWSGWRMPSGWRGWLAAGAGLGLLIGCGREAFPEGSDAGWLVLCCGGFAAGAACLLCHGILAPTADPVEAPPASATAKLTKATPPGGSVRQATKASADRPGTFGNSIGMRFVAVPVGGKEVLFSLWETRRKDYEAYAEASSGVDDSWKNPGFDQDHNHPVVNVSWEDAARFCAWLTENERKEGKIPAGAEYRLPSDHEWSCAVGIGEREDATQTPKEKDEKIQGVYPWGTQWPPPKGAGNYGSSLGVDKFDRTSPVGSFAASGLGLHDLGGNVWEWCDDFYDGNSGLRALRGGSWFSFGRVYLLSSSRLFNSPGYRSSSGGFRCVLELSAR